MIYMPASLFPDRDTITITNDAISFTAQIQNGSNIDYINDETYVDDDGKSYKLCRVSMIFAINDSIWFYPFNKEAYTTDVSIGNSKIHSIVGKAYPTLYGIKIVVTMDISQRYFGYSLHDGDTISSMTTTCPPLSAIMNFGTLCSWKMRIYEKDSCDIPKRAGSIQVAYGVVSEVSTNTDRDGNNTVVLKTTPHTNIYDFVNGLSSGTSKVGSTTIPNGYYLTSGDTDKPVQSTINEILRYVDVSNSNYYIEINGIKYLIDYYRLFLADNKDSSFNISYKNSYFDEYGNPLYGYMSLNYLDGDYSWTKIRTAYLNNVFREGISYSIYTNFIDSKFAYFTLEKEAVITITESKGNNISDTAFDNPYILDYCNLKLNVDYSHDNGAFANFYSFKVYEYNEKEQRYIFRYSSGNRYNQEIKCEYEKFFNDKLYLIEITIIDNMGRTYEKEVYIKTEFSSYFMGGEATAEFYRNHHSIIVDWSNSTSINPSVFGTYSYVSVINGEIDENSNEMNCVKLCDDCDIVYDKDDEGNPLHFENSFIALKLKIDTSTYGKFFEVSTADGYKAEISYDGEKLIVLTSNGKYEYRVYGKYNKDNIETALKSDELNYHYPYIYNEITKEIKWNDDYYTHTEDRLCNGEFIIKIKTDIKTDDNGVTGVQFLHTDNGVDFEDWVVTYYPNDTIRSNGLSYVRYIGNAIYNKMTVVNNYSETNVDDDTKGNEWKWYENSVLLCDYHLTLNGKNYEADLKNICGYKVYKTFGETDDTLYEIADLNGTDFKTVEDFVIGDMCKYTYYIYPKVIDKEHSDLYSIGTVISTEPIQINNESLAVFGLTKIGDKKFIPNLDEVWTFSLDLSDEGWTMNNDKTYYDNILSRYTQESIGARAYLTKNVTSLIGKIDCSTNGEYEDDYDMLVTWINFTKSSCEKCLVDVRGLVLPGNFESNVSGKYEIGKGNPCSTTFTWRQKSDLDIITIYAIPLAFNPLHYEYLYGSDETTLLGSEPSILYGSMG